MTSATSPLSPLATHLPTASSLLAPIKERAITARPKTLDQARQEFAEIAKLIDGVSSCAQAQNLTGGGALTAIKDIVAATGRPRNFEAACGVIAQIGKIAADAASAAPQVSLPAAAKSAPTATSQGPKIESPAPPPTDAELLAAYVQLEGDQRRAFFALHGGAIWRAHERAMRSTRRR